MSSTDEKINDIDISCQGIDLLVNNDWDGCEKLYAKYKLIAIRSFFFIEDYYYLIFFDLFIEINHLCLIIATVLFHLR
jgi:hypothetical protein